jgi:hypothetical protein
MHLALSDMLFQTWVTSGCTLHKIAVCGLTTQCLRSPAAIHRTATLFLETRDRNLNTHSHENLKSHLQFFYQNVLNDWISRTSRFIIFLLLFLLVLPSCNTGCNRKMKTDFGHKYHITKPEKMSILTGVRKYYFVSYSWKSTYRDLVSTEWVLRSWLQIQRSRVRFPALPDFSEK